LSLVKRPPKGLQSDSMVALSRKKRMKSSGQKPVKICLALSFLFHAVMVFALKDVFLLEWAPRDLRTYTVELVRPPLEDPDLRDTQRTEVSEIKEEKVTPPEESQDTISLNTSDKRYVSYARVIKERILAHWRYPTEAKSAFLQGRLRVLFSLNRRGDIIDIRVLRASGHDVLDQEAVRAVSTAAPFPPFPRHITVSRLNINADFEYRLKRKRP